MGRVEQSAQVNERETPSPFTSWVARLVLGYWIIFALCRVDGSDPAVAPAELYSAHFVPADHSAVRPGQVIHVWMPDSASDASISVLVNDRAVQAPVTRFDLSSGTVFQVQLPGDARYPTVQARWGQGSLARARFRADDDLDPVQAAPARLRTRLRAQKELGWQREVLTVDSEASVYAVAWAPSAKAYREGKRELRLLPATKSWEHDYIWSAGTPALPVGNRVSELMLPGLDDDTVLGAATVGSDGTFELPSEGQRLGDLPRRLVYVPMKFLFEALYFSLWLVSVLLPLSDARRVERLLSRAGLKATFIGSGCATVAIALGLVPLSSELPVLLAGTLTGASSSILLRLWYSDRRQTLPAAELRPSGTCNG